MVNIKKIETRKDYDDFLSDSEKLLMLKFGAAWCGPCRTIASNIQNLTNETIEGVNIGEIDVDNEELEDLISEYNIRAVPVIAFLKNGEVVDKLIGMQTVTDITEKISSLK